MKKFRLFFVAALLGVITCLAFTGCNDTSVSAADVLNGEWEPVITGYIYSRYDRENYTVGTAKFELENNSGKINYTLNKSPISFDINCTLRFEKGNSSQDTYRKVDDYLYMTYGNGQTMDVRQVSNNVIVIDPLATMNINKKGAENVVFTKKTESSLVDNAKLAGTYNFAVRAGGSNYEANKNFPTRLAVENEKVKVTKDGQETELSAVAGLFTLKIAVGYGNTNEYIFCPIETNDNYIVYSATYIVDGEIKDSVALRFDK